jgi:hypothetical protein
MSRSVTVLALPPHHYGQPKGMFWKGIKEHDRFPPTYPDQDACFEEYMAHPTNNPSRFEAQLAKSSGLLELHYDTMRKKQKERAGRECHVAPPTMGRSFTAASGYGGFIPGKMSNNVCGCTFAQGSRLSKELRPLSGVGSGLVFTLGSKSTSALPSLNATQQSGFGDGAYARQPALDQTF